MRLGANYRGIELSPNSTGLGSTKIEVQNDLLEKWDLWSKNDILSIIFSDFQLKSFVDPKPVELRESAIHQKFCLSKLVWLQK